MSIFKKHITGQLFRGRCYSGIRNRVFDARFMVPFFLFVLAFMLSFQPTTSYARYAALVMDSRTGEILYSRNADTKLYPASLTKIMTLYMTFDALNRGRLRLDQRLSVSARAAGQAPTKLRLKKGGTITVRDAVFALITKSANDAATVLAEGMAKTEQAFALKMTATAKRLGMRRTSFRNASGLPNRRQKSTARDMALLGAALIHEFPQYYHFMAMEKFNYKGRNYKNHNNLLKKYKGADGIKTGYIRASGFNLVASAKRGNHRLVGVIFGGRTAKSRDKHMATLLDRSFAMIEKASPSSVPLPAYKPALIALGSPHSNPQSKSKPKAKPIQVAEVITSAPEPALVKKPAKVSGIKVVKGGSASSKSVTTITAATDELTIIEEKWAIQIGAYSRVTTARDQLSKAAAQANGHLDGRRVNIERAISNGKPFYRAQMIGFNEIEARAACDSLSERRFSCFVVSPSLELPAYIAEKSQS
ncbi:MAG: D-alanyl-D-alanine carboxypeptidase [Sneathiella sp.]|uniref:D-alanyl-D-alanine carboxypeptidase n=1 Tax=Sneathiella sp. TaxID=1964365 RepID=UPI003002217D